jgi:hypothetical protein
MSLTKNDRKVRSKSGKTFPNGTEGQPRFADAIASALKAEFGGSPAAIKSIVKLTRTGERTVRNWFEGKNGPSGDNLMTLMRHSDEVLRTVLDLSDRRELALASDLSLLKQRMMATIATIDDVTDR